MAWLLILFIMNGELTISDDFPARQVPVSECDGLQQDWTKIMEQAFPALNGLVVCIYPEVSGVSA